MVSVVGFNKRVPPSAASRGTLAELVAKQKLLAEQQAGFGQIQPIQSWTQGAAQMTGALMTGLQQGRAAREESEGRQRLAEIRAGINLDTGATSEQIAQAGLLDEDYARDLQEGAVRARQAAREAQALIDAREDEQRARAGESALERDARHAENAAQNAVTIRGQDIDVKQGETTAAETARANAAQEAATISGQDITKRGQDITAATAAEQAKIERDKMAATAAEPSTELAKLVDDYNNNRFGPKGSQEAKAILNAGLAKETAATKGIQLNVDKDGNISFSQGGTAGAAGDPTGSNPDLKNQADLQNQYLTDQKAANSALAGVQSARSALGSAGYQGPGGGVLGSIDDIIEGVQGEFGVPKEARSFLSLPGDPKARALIDIASLSQQLEKVQQTVGAVSNNEMNIFKEASVGMGKNKEANEMILDMAEAIIERTNERAQRAGEYAKLHGGRVDAGFEAEWNNYINANPLIGKDKNGLPVFLGKGPTQTRAEQITTAPDVTAPAATAPNAAPAVENFPPRPVSEWDDDELAAGHQLR